ncbi:hypothetical protein [Polaribacter tangerinus]|uniref:hypothetical protein n=1 Tax=Polaribacter tangerinus TaxID=1920034 RepID=UPI00117F043D|nr:hypothetical protein [Polaribacter tangerinus]
MENQGKTETWKPDETTFNKIQEIKKFVDFAANLDFVNDENKLEGKEIKYLIENINNPETHKNWNVCLDIFDPEIQKGIEKEGFYWRKWSVYFEIEKLEIEAESNHTADALGHHGDDFCYYGAIYFGKDTKGQRIYMDVDIKKFIKDAMNYKNYITEPLTDIEVDIDIWENKKHE